MLIFGVVIWIGYVLYLNQNLDFRAILIPSIFGMLCLGLFKLFIIGWVLFGGGSYDTAMELIKTVTNHTVMGMNISEGVSRLQFGNDFAGPFILCFLVFSEDYKIKFSPVQKWSMVLIIVFSIFISFSRYLWAVLLVIGLLAVLRFLLINPKSALVCFFLLCSLAPVAFTSDFAQTVIEVRFNSSTATDGDDMRVEQRRALLGQFSKAPLLGNGFGSSVETMVRNEDALYSYETQWYALLMQVGLAGICLLLAGCIWIALRIYLNLKAWARWVALIMFGLFLLSGMTNPTLTSSTSAIVFLVFITAAGSGRTVFGVASAFK
jgi:O-antigen ligase